MNDSSHIRNIDIDVINALYDFLWRWADFKTVRFYDEKPLSFAIGIKSAELDDNKVTCDSSLYAELEDKSTVGGTS